VAESLYASIEGPKGTAEIYEVVTDANAAIGSVRPDDVWYEVRFKGQNEKFWQEGEAAAAAHELAGLQF
jgi:hypothetical protein